MPLKVFTTFSGYDSQLLALRRIAVDFDCVGWSEIEPNAIKAHNALFPEYADRNYGDITKIDWNAVPDFDLLTYSSPCQDFSIAGLQQGGEKGSGTRSSLLWEVEKAIATKRPKWLLMENVPALTTKTFMPLLRRWLDTLTRYGYTNYAKCLNAKDYGVPQSRNRLFVVSTLGKEPFFFPKKKRLEKRLCHVLEVDGVPENFYYTDAQLEGRFASKYMARKKIQDAYGDEISRCILAHEGKEPLLLKVNEPQIECVGSLKGGAWDARQESTRRVYSPDGISPTLNCCEGGGLQTKILSKQHGDRIRRLTPRECFRLMDVDDIYIDRIQAAGISNSQQYKLAGNSIVVAVLADIFRKMFVDRESETQQRELF